VKTPDQTSPSENEAIEATAAAWLAQRDDGLNGAQLAEFARWHEADPRHAAALARLEETWALLGQLREYRPEARVHPDRDLLAQPQPTLAFYRPAVAAAGLLAAALAVAAVWWWAQPVAPLTGPQQYATTTGGYQRMILADGSVVELNADSEVRVAYAAAERRVYLVKGEAHFSVTKNPARPFWVEAGSVQVRAVGTAFNVRLGAAEIEVLVTEGKVEVDQPGGGAAARSMLEAGQRLVLAQQSAVVAPTVEKIAPAAMRNALAWQDKLLILSDQPLGEVVAQFNQHNRVQLELADPALASKIVGGSWRASNLDGFVSWLAGDDEILVERPEPGRIILRQAP
jgi:transmembrane sensor